MYWHCTGLPEAELAALAVTAPMTAAELSQLPLPERHIVSKCHQLVAKVTAGLESYDMGDTGRLIYEFLWDEYADWYIEASKVSIWRSFCYCCY
jgi:valyl-tRNA synthetase